MSRFAANLDLGLSDDDDPPPSMARRGSRGGGIKRQDSVKDDLKDLLNERDPTMMFGGNTTRGGRRGSHALNFDFSGGDPLEAAVSNFNRRGPAAAMEPEEDMEDMDPEFFAQIQAALGASGADDGLSRGMDPMSSRRSASPAVPESEESLDDILGDVMDDRPKKKPPPPPSRSAPSSAAGLGDRFGGDQRSTPGSRRGSVREDSRGPDDRYGGDLRSTPGSRRGSVREDGGGFGDQYGGDQRSSPGSRRGSVREDSIGRGGADSPAVMSRSPVGSRGDESPAPTSRRGTLSRPPRANSRPPFDDAHEDMLPMDRHDDDFGLGQRDMPMDRHDDDFGLGQRNLGRGRRDSAPPGDDDFGLGRRGRRDSAPAAPQQPLFNVELNVSDRRDPSPASALNVELNVKPKRKLQPKSKPSPAPSAARTPPMEEEVPPGVKSMPSPAPSGRATPPPAYSAAPSAQDFPAELGSPARSMLSREQDDKDDDDFLDDLMPDNTKQPSAAATPSMAAPPTPPPAVEPQRTAEARENSDDDLPDFMKGGREQRVRRGQPSEVPRAMPKPAAFDLGFSAEELEPSDQSGSMLAKPSHDPEDASGSGSGLLDVQLSVKPKAGRKILKAGGTPKAAPVSREDDLAADHSGSGPSSGPSHGMPAQFSAHVSPQAKASPTQQGMPAQVPPHISPQSRVSPTQQGMPAQVPPQISPQSRVSPTQQAMPMDFPAHVSPQARISPTQQGMPMDFPPHVSPQARVSPTQQGMPAQFQAHLSPQSKASPTYSMAPSAGPSMVPSAGPSAIPSASPSAAQSASHGTGQSGSAQLRSKAPSSVPPASEHGSVPAGSPAPSWNFGAQVEYGAAAYAVGIPGLPTPTASSLAGGNALTPRQQAAAMMAGGQAVLHPGALQGVAGTHPGALQGYAVPSHPGMSSAPPSVIGDGHAVPGLPVANMPRAYQPADGIPPGSPLTQTAQSENGSLHARFRAEETFAGIHAGHAEVAANMAHVHAPAVVGRAGSPPPSDARRSMAGGGGSPGSEPHLSLFGGDAGQFDIGGRAYGGFSEFPPLAAAPSQDLLCKLAASEAKVIHLQRQLELAEQSMGERLSAARKQAEAEQGSMELQCRRLESEVDRCKEIHKGELDQLHTEKQLLHQRFEREKEEARREERKKAQSDNEKLKKDHDIELEELRRRYERSVAIAKQQADMEAENLKRAQSGEHQLTKLVEQVQGSVAEVERMSRRVDADKSLEWSVRERNLEAREKSVREMEARLSSQSKEVEDQRRRVSELVRHMEDSQVDDRESLRLERERLQDEHKRLLALQQTVRDADRNNKEALKHAWGQLSDERHSFQQEQLRAESALQACREETELTERQQRQEAERLKTLHNQVDVARQNASRRIRETEALVANERRALMSDLEVFEEKRRIFAAEVQKMDDEKNRLAEDRSGFEQEVRSVGQMAAEVQRKSEELKGLHKQAGEARGELLQLRDQLHEERSAHSTEADRLKTMQTLVEQQRLQLLQTENQLRIRGIEDIDLLVKTEAIVPADNLIQLDGARGGFAGPFGMKSGTAAPFEVQGGFNYPFDIQSGFNNPFDMQTGLAGPFEAQRGLAGPHDAFGTVYPSARSVDLWQC